MRLIFIMLHGVVLKGFVYDGVYLHFQRGVVQ
jgi:hypothetical protein